MLEVPAHAFGDGQDPLAEGDAGQDVVDQVGGRLDHAAGAATGAQVADLAGEGDQVLVLAGGAADPGEAVSRDAAAQVFAQGAFGGGADRAQVVVTGLGDGEEGLEVLAHGAVQDGGGRTAGAVDGGRAGGGTGADRGGGG